MCGIDRGGAIGTGFSFVSWGGGSHAQHIGNGHQRGGTIAFDTIWKAVVTYGALLLLAAGFAHAGTWESHGPIGGNGMAVAVAPSEPTTIYAGTNGGGIFKSTDGGATWSAVGGGISSPGDWNVEALVVDPKTPARAYAAVSSGASGGVFRTTNGGASWTLSSFGFATDIAIDPATPKNLWATGAAVYKSTDSGATWTPFFAGTTFHSVAVDPSAPSTVYAGTIFGTIYKTTNAGTDWTPLNGLPSDHVDAIAVDPTNSSIVYAGLEDFGVYKTFNGGMDWTPFGPTVGSQDVSVQDLAIDPTDTGTVYVGGFVSGPGTSVGVYKSTNGGETWDETPLVALVRSLALDPANPSNLIAAAQDGFGLWRSPDGGDSWDVSNQGFVNTNIGALATAPTLADRVYAGAANRGCPAELAPGDCLCVLGVVAGEGPDGGSPLRLGGNSCVTVTKPAPPPTTPTTPVTSPPERPATTVLPATQTRPDPLVPATDPCLWPSCPAPVPSTPGSCWPWPASRWSSGEGRSPPAGSIAGHAIGPLTPPRTPKGTHDVLPPESGRWAALIAAFASRAGRFGYGLVMTPAYEHVEVFHRFGRGHRRRPQGDVRVRGQGRPEAGPAARGDRSGGAGLRPAPPDCAMEGLVPSPRTSATRIRRRAGTASTTSSAPRSSASTTRPSTSRSSRSPTASSARSGCPASGWPSTRWATASAGRVISRPCGPTCGLTPASSAKTAGPASRPTRCGCSTARSRAASK